MAIGGEIHQANTWARQAIEHLMRDGLPPLPDNYAVYFYYHAGTNPNLRMAMDLLMQQTGMLTQQQVHDLYATHLGLAAEQKVLMEANARIEAEIQKVMSVIDAANTGTEKFGQTLNTFEGKLSTSNSLDQIREVVAKVANETRVIAQQNERLHTQLTEATEQLTETRYNLDAVHRESQIDALTEVGNRKFFSNELARSINEAAENNTPLSLLIADIDHFKKFNDTFGHIIGDQVLRLVARTLVENLKGRDVIARYGGEEFVILLPQTKLSDAERVANLLRDALGTKQIKRRSTNETLGVVTISIGAAEYCPLEDAEGFIARADAGLYKAKQTGRNKVVSEALTEEQIAEIKAKPAVSTQPEPVPVS